MAHSSEELGAFSVGRDGSVIMASPRALEMIGYDLFEVLGKPFADFIAEGSLEDAMKSFELTLQGNETDVELGLRKKDGNVLRIRARSIPDRDGGEILGAVGTIEEVK